MRRVLLLIVLAAVALGVAPALTQGEQACNELRNAVEQQGTSGPDGANAKIGSKEQSACVKVS